LHTPALEWPAATCRTPWSGAARCMAAGAYGVAGANEVAARRARATATEDELAVQEAAKRTQTVQCTQAQKILPQAIPRSSAMRAHCVKPSMPLHGASSLTDCQFLRGSRI